MDRVKVARELVKLAKSLVADYQRNWTFKMIGTIKSVKKGEKYYNNEEYDGLYARAYLTLPGNIEPYKTNNNNRKDFLNNYLNQNKEIVEEALLKEYVNHWDLDEMGWDSRYKFVKEFLTYPIHITKMDVVEQDDTFCIDVEFNRQFKDFSETGKLQLVPDDATKTAINSMLVNNGF